MYDINYRNLRKGISFGLIFFIIGLFFLLIIGYVTFGGIIKKMFMDSSVEAYKIEENCSSDEDSTSCYPIYSYRVNSNRYTCKVIGSVGSSVNKKYNKVYYDSKNPSDCVVEYSTKPNFIIIIFLFIPIISVAIGLRHIVNTIKKIRKVKYLANNGTLISGLAYTLKDTGMAINGREIMAPVVDYTLPSGAVVPLVGDARYDYKLCDSDGKVDLLIDMNDISNYYIDFEIKKK